VEELGVTFHRRNLPHLQRDNKAHFLTFATKNRSTLPDWARDIVLACCLHGHKTKFYLWVAVVMPDHVHLILTPFVDYARQEVISLSEIMRAIKGVSAHAINRKFGHTGTIWQQESFDHVLRSSESLDGKIIYILENPVRGGLVKDWKDYRWLWREDVG
jgi:REP element-mobilizing transposase RayT